MKEYAKSKKKHKLKGHITYLQFTIELSNVSL